MLRPSTAARRHAEAIFEIARRDGTEDAWLARLQTAARVLGPDDVLGIVENPAIPLVQRVRAVERALDAAGARAGDARPGDAPSPDGDPKPGDPSPVDAQLDNLVASLVERRRVSMLAAIATEYGRLLERHRGIEAALVTSADPLTVDETRAIAARIESLTGSSSVSLRSALDPALIGGVTVRIGDRLIDASVRGRLDRLRDRLAAGAR